MKYLNSLKGMKKSVKVGLATSAVYAATSLALPAFAHLGNPIQSLDIKEVTTVEQTKSLYKEKLAEYAVDKIIDHNEIAQLVEIKDKECYIIKKQLTSQKEERSELMRGCFNLLSKLVNFSL